MKHKILIIFILMSIFNLTTYAEEIEKPEYKIGFNIKELDREYKDFNNTIQIVEERIQKEVREKILSKKEKALALKNIAATLDTAIVTKVGSITPYADSVRIKTGKWLVHYYFDNTIDFIQLNITGETDFENEFNLLEESVYAEVEERRKEWKEYEQKHSEDYTKAIRK